MDSISELAVTTPTEARCRHCDYRLRSLPNPVCPECGSPFDPADPRTYKMPGSLDVLRALARPPSIVEIIVSVGVVASVLYEAARLDPSRGPWMLGLPIIAVHLLRFIAILAEWRTTQSNAEQASQRGKRISWSRWCVTPIGLLLVITAWTTDWPLRLRFEISRPALMRVINRSAAGQTSSAGVSAPAIPGWVGLFYVREVHRYIDDRVDFDFDSTRGLWGWGALCYMPRASSPNPDRWLPTQWRVCFV